jgi:hypothetical protein
VRDEDEYGGKMKMKMKMKMKITVGTPFTAILSCYVVVNALLRYVMIQAYCLHTDHTLHTY